MNIIMQTAQSLVVSWNGTTSQNFCFDHFTVEKSNWCRNKKHYDSKTD